MNISGFCVMQDIFFSKSIITPREGVFYSFFFFSVMHWNMNNVLILIQINNRMCYIFRQITISWNLFLGRGKTSGTVKCFTMHICHDTIHLPWKNIGFFPKVIGFNEHFLERYYMYIFMANAVVFQERMYCNGLYHSNEESLLPSPPSVIQD